MKHFGEAIITGIIIGGGWAILGALFGPIEAPPWMIAGSVAFATAWLVPND